jgi:hypothetical protein
LIPKARDLIRIRRGYWQPSGKGRWLNTTPRQPATVKRGTTPGISSNAIMYRPPGTMRAASGEGRSRRQWPVSLRGSADTPAAVAIASALGAVRYGWSQSDVLAIRVAVIAAPAAIAVISTRTAKGVAVTPVSTKMITAAQAAKPFSAMK